MLEHLAYGEHEVIVKKLADARYSVRIDGSVPFVFESSVADLERNIRESIATYEGVQRVRRDLDIGIW